MASSRPLFLTVALLAVLSCVSAAATAETKTVEKATVKKASVKHVSLKKAVVKKVAVEKAAVKKNVAVKVSPELTMMSLSAATMKFSPVMTSTYFTNKSPAYLFMLNNLKARNLEQVTFFYPTDKALKKHLASQKQRPANCPAVDMRNHLAQQMVPGRWTAKDLRKIMYRGKLDTMSPIKLSIFRSKKNILQVGLLNNGYSRVISQANIVKADAVVSRGYVLHLVDQVLDICI